MNLARNFFAGTLHEYIFTDLVELKYFNISINNIGGPVPLLFQHSPILSHLDIHANRFTGPLSSSIEKMTNLQYLDLQGNGLRGDLPIELKNLTKLEILVLSHNEFFGTIPSGLGELSRLNKLYLHANELSGEAPKLNNEIGVYITDCGDPSTSLEPINCPDCTICCNGDGLCQERSKSKKGPKFIAITLIFSVVGLMLLLYKIKHRITNIRCVRKFFEEQVTTWSASDLIGDRTVYHFFVTPNKYGKICISFIIYYQSFGFSKS